MNEHPTHWLASYYDGELPAQYVREVAAHLTTCAACREELAQLRALRTLLFQASAPAAPARFQAEIGLRLSSRRTPSPIPQVFRWAGWLIPVVLLLSATVAQTVQWLTRALILIAQTSWGRTWLAWLLPQGGAVTGDWQSLLRYLNVGFWQGAIPALLSLSVLLLGIAWLSGMATNQRLSSMPDVAGIPQQSTE